MQKEKVEWRAYVTVTPSGNLRHDHHHHTTAQHSMPLYKVYIYMIKQGGHFKEEQDP